MPEPDQFYDSTARDFSGSSWAKVSTDHSVARAGHKSYYQIIGINVYQDHVHHCLREIPTMSPGLSLAIQES